MSVVNAKVRSLNSAHDDRFYLVKGDLSALFTMKAEENDRDERYACMNGWPLQKLASKSAPSAFVYELFDTD
jgi:hypothetical protein